MPKGKFARKTKNRRLKLNGKAILLLALMALLFGAVTGVAQGTLAYLFDADDPVENVFIAGQVQISVVGDGTSVTIQNTGNVDAYVRAMTVVTWQDSQGKIHPDAPVENVDYTVSWNTGDWTPPVDGNAFYTYKEKVAPQSYTAVLFADCAALDGRVPEDCHLVVDVIAEAVQADDYGLQAWND